MLNFLTFLLFLNLSFDYFEYYIEILAGHVYVVHVNYEQKWAKNRPLWHTSTYIGSVGVYSIKVHILFPAMQITLEPF